MTVYMLCLPVPHVCWLSAYLPAWSSESLCDLTHICAAVSSSCGPKTNRELMGAFRALCMPSQGLKGSHAGYSLLTGRTNVSFVWAQKVKGDHSSRQSVDMSNKKKGGNTGRKNKVEKCKEWNGKVKEGKEWSQ